MRQARDRRPAARLGRRAGDLHPRGRLRLEPAEGARVPRLLDQPLQPASRCAARRRAHHCRLAPGAWLVGFVALLALVIWKPNPILIIILLFSATELWRRWEDASLSGDAGVLPRRAGQRLIVGAPVTSVSPRCSCSACTRRTRLASSDGKQTDLSAEEKTEDLEQDIAVIAQEFREGFQASTRSAGGDHLRSARIRKTTRCMQRPVRQADASPNSAGRS